MLVTALLGYALEGAVAALSCVLAKRRAYHRPFAFYALYVAISDPLRAILRLFRPYSSLGFMAFPMRSFSALLFIGMNVALATACAESWAPSIWPHVLGAGLAAGVVGLAFFPKGYPAAFLFGVQVVGQLIGWSLFVWELQKGRKHWASSYSVALALCLALDAAFLVGPYLGDVFSGWAGGIPAVIAVNVALLALHMSWLSSLTLRED